MCCTKRKKAKTKALKKKVKKIAGAAKRDIQHQLSSL